MQAFLARLDDEAREALRRSARQHHQHFRGMASTAVRRRARLLSAGGRVGSVEAHEYGASARVEDDSRTHRVLFLWSDEDATRCTCAPFSRRATCPHVIALLDAILAALGGSVQSTAPPPEPAAPSPREAEWLARIERYRDAIEGARASGRRGDDDPWHRATEAGATVRYVLRFVERRGGPVALLEARVLVRPDDWRTIPFASTDPKAGVDVASLGGEHAVVAAVATGAADSTWVQRSASREVSLARVQRAIAAPLLGAASRAGELLLSAEVDGDLAPLDARLAHAATFTVAAEDEAREVWSIAGSLVERDGRRHDVRHIVGASNDGIVAVRDGDAIAIVLVDSLGAVPVMLDLAESPLAVPREDVETLSVLAGIATLEGEQLATIARPVTPRACLDVDAPLANAQRGTWMETHLRFEYGGTSVRPGDRSSTVQTLDGRASPRDDGFERAALARLVEVGARPVHGKDHDAVIAGDAFVPLATTLVTEGWRVSAQSVELRAPGPVHLSVRSGVDWFDLEGDVSFGGEDVPFPRVLDAAVRQRSHVELGDGSIGLLPSTWLRRWNAATIGTPEDEAVRFARSQGPLLAALVDDEEVRGDALATLRAELADLSEPGAVDPPDEFTGELRPYQREGLGWLLHLDRVGLSGCLADDMGLGKTVQLLAYLAVRAKENGGEHMLVVAPRSLVHNWLSEAARFVPGLPTLDFTGPDRWRRLGAAAPGSLLVTTYGTLRRDAEELTEREFDVVVLDEAQAIKSRASATARAARSLVCDRRVALSGTPIENHLGELWSLLEFLNPGLLGAATAFERLGAPRAQDDMIDEGRELLSRALKPFFLRRRKWQVASELPPKTEQVLRAPLAAAQRTAYEELAAYYRQELSKSKGQKRKEKMEDPTKLDLNVLAALTRLRQCACHPGLVDRELVSERSGKLDLVVPMLTDATRSGSKAIVFSSFTKLLGLVRSRLEAERVPYVVLDGSTTDRETPVERFQTAEEGMVFLISIKAGGAGLNLTAADFVFLLDPWWNPAVEAQAIDRAHRIGRERPVHVYRVLTEETVEAHVVELQTKKRDLADSVLGEVPSALGDFTRDDLAFLLH